MSRVPFNADPDAGLDKNHRSATNTHNRSKIFAIGACLMSAITTIVGGTLIGIYFRKAVNNCEDARKRLGDDNLDHVNNEDCVGPSGLFWGAVVCLVIAFISGIGFVFFVLLHCARRGRRNIPPFLYQAATSYNTGYTQPQPYDPYAAQSCGYPLQPTQGNPQPDVQPPSYFAPQHDTAQTAPEYEHAQSGSSSHPQLEGNRAGGSPQRFY